MACSGFSLRHCWNTTDVIETKALCLIPINFPFSSATLCGRNTTILTQHHASKKTDLLFGVQRGMPPARPSPICPIDRWLHPIHFIHSFIHSFASCTVTHGQGKPMALLTWRQKTKCANFRAPLSGVTE